MLLLLSLLLLSSPSLLVSMSSMPATVVVFYSFCFSTRGATDSWVFCLCSRNSSLKFPRNIDEEKVLCVYIRRRATKRKCGEDGAIFVAAFPALPATAVT